MIMKVLIVDDLYHSLQKRLTEKGIECHIDLKITYDKAKDLISDFNGLIIRSRFVVDASFLDSASQLKFIARAGSGMENIDVNYATEKGIVCVNSPEGNCDSVGEHALGLLLSLNHKINSSHLKISAGEWPRKSYKIFELMGKTLGIIGYGNTGSALARKISGLGLKVMAYDKYKFNYSDEFVKESTMEELFHNCDIVSFHLPLTSETHYLANSHYFNQFKKAITIINTSRGQVINSNDLVLAIQNEKVLGAGLDVVEFEDDTFNQLKPESHESEIWKFLKQSDKVVLSPHIAGQSQESFKRHADILFQKICEYL